MSHYKYYSVKKALNHGKKRDKKLMNALTDKSQFAPLESSRQEKEDSV